LKLVVLWWFGLLVEGYGKVSRPDFVFKKKSGADERIRTADPLFTNQPAIEFTSRFSLSMYSKDVH